MVLVEAGDLIPGDGDTIEGVASVKESAITGESAPVIREAGATARLSRSTVLTDWIRVKITAAPGSTFIDRMIPLVEGAERQKTPNELALSILLSGLTIIFLIVCVTLSPVAGYSGTVLSVTVLVVIGLIETHGRRETEALTEGLETLPRRKRTTGADSSRNSTSTPHWRANPSLLSSTSSLTPMHPTAVIPNAGRTSKNCSAPASTSGRRSKSSIREFGGLVSRITCVYGARPGIAGGGGRHSRRHHAG
jgi:hypothetical protein